MGMENLTLKCPLCCEETFSSYSSLKYHILSITENLLCPGCSKTFHNIYDLTDHLEKECREDDGPDEPTMPELIYYSELQNSESIPVETIIPKSEKETEDDIYFCHSCNINIHSVEEHLAEYHQDEYTTHDPEEETENSEFTEEVPIESYYSEEKSDANDADGETENEKDYRKDNDKQPGSNINIPPMTEQYAVDSAGKVRKLAEIKGSVDKNSIFLIYQCPTCYLQFPLLDHYKSHKCKLRLTKNKFKCIHCAKIFDFYDDLNEHMKKHLRYESADGKTKRIITMEPYRCDVCHVLFPSNKSLRTHQRVHGGKKDNDPTRSYSIGEDDEEKSTGQELVRRMFVCSLCNGTFDKEYEEVHMNSHSEIENFNCSICNKKFYTKENLEMHCKAHNQTPKLSCTYCKKTFIADETLQDHIANQCQDRQFECQYCGRRFSKCNEKVKHERIHTGEKPHVCHICGKSFRVSYCLTLHLRIHSGSRPYKCETCNKRFKSHSVYNHHLLTHSNVRAYKCPFCPKAFKTGVQLAGHKNSHTKPFSCTVCNRPFASLYMVRAHMESHKKENHLKYDCQLCGATYVKAYALRDHLKTHTEEEFSRAEKEMTEMEMDTDQSASKSRLQMEIQDEEQNVSSTVQV